MSVCLSVCSGYIVPASSLFPLAGWSCMSGSDDDDSLVRRDTAYLLHALVLLLLRLKLLARRNAVLEFCAALESRQVRGIMPLINWLIDTTGKRGEVKGGESVVPVWSFWNSSVSRWGVFCSAMVGWRDSDGGGGGGGVCMYVWR